MDREFFGAPLKSWAITGAYALVALVSVGAVVWGMKQDQASSDAQARRLQTAGGRRRK